ncbi:MAG: hypothetical protein IPM29_23440 [Planctomycetes bacterium]|nr:hypothetical protein [Planctomycetota bacterium]
MPTAAGAHLVPTVVLAVALAACSLQQAGRATPQRPSVSFDTATTAVGTFELETGVSFDPGDVVDTPSTLKYGTSERSELFVGWSPLQVLGRPGDDAIGTGDVVMGARHRLWDADGVLPSAAVVISGKIPAASASDGLGSGQVDLRVGGVLNRQLGPVSANLFYQYGELGVPGGGTTSEHTATLTAGIGLGDNVGAFVEVGSVVVDRPNRNAVFVITGAAWACSPAVVLDAGINTGLSDDAADLQLLLGCTWNFGAPFADR